MTYIHNRLTIYLLGALLLTSSSCSSLLNTTPTKSLATVSAKRPPNQKAVARPVRLDSKKAVGQPTRKVSPVTSTAVRRKPSTNQLPLANRAEVPIKETRKRASNMD